MLTFVEFEWYVYEFIIKVFKLFCMFENLDSTMSGKKIEM